MPSLVQRASGRKVHSIKLTAAVTVEEKQSIAAKSYKLLHNVQELAYFVASIIIIIIIIIILPRKKLKRFRNIKTS